MTKTDYRVPRPQPSPPRGPDGFRRRLFREGALPETVQYLVEGINLADSQTSLDVGFGGGEPLATDAVGVPVLDRMVATAARAQVAASWMSDDTPSGDWTVTLWRRRPSENFTAVATATISTS